MDRLGACTMHHAPPPAWVKMPWIPVPVATPMLPQELLAMVPKPVAAVLLLFPVTEATEAARKAEQGARAASPACLHLVVSPGDSLARDGVCCVPPAAAAVGRLMRCS